MKKLFLILGLSVGLMYACSGSKSGLRADIQLPADTSAVEVPKASDVFQEPQLRQLIDTAVRNNPDLLGQIAVLQQARAELTARKFALLPAVDVFAGTGLRRFGEYTIDGVGNFDTNFSPNIRPDQRMSNPLPDLLLTARVSWELDIWGRLRSMRTAAAKRYLASEAGLHWQKTILASEVASAFYELKALNEIQRIVSQNATLQEAGLALVKIKLEAGRLNALAVQQFEAQLARTRSMYHALEADKLRTLNQLNFHLGKVQGVFADTSTLSTGEIKEINLKAVPASVLRTRPDVVAASMELDAAGADVRAMQAAFYPQLILGPEIGFHSFNPSKWISPASLAWNMVGGITAPVFAQRRLKADLAKSRAMQEQAFQNYRRTAIQAYTEIFNGMQQAQQIALQITEKSKEVASLKEGVKSANELFAAGYATYLEVVVAQNNVLEAEVELVQLQLARQLNTVELYRALGGGW
jgi:HAE1 family hydrophobic/amphiphilic exporter-1